VTVGLRGAGEVELDVFSARGVQQPVGLPEEHQDEVDPHLVEQAGAQQLVRGAAR
jgi:hypothetical protein